ncbi:MAG: cell division protein FtsQ/DivIB [Thiohalocapsa sp.]|nr:cell division protein FtsQ/DivIB [Thiohalocapsa sp.]MCF7988983.1 cell division protein FtsQ/DivIB [Thiohalocapsa sp.]
MMSHGPVFPEDTVRGDVRHRDALRRDADAPDRPAQPEHDGAADLGRSAADSAFSVASVAPAASAELAHVAAHEQPAIPSTAAAGRPATQAPERPQPPPRTSTGALIARLVTAVVLMGSLVGAVFVALDWEPRVLPVRIVTIEGEMRGLSRESLQETIGGQITGGIVTQNLNALKDEVEGLPWIHRASVRRVWPDRLVFTVEEHEALARWGENGLVTAEGIVFRPRDGRLPAGLVRLSGADDFAPEVVERYLQWHPRLAELGLIIDALVRDARGDWSLQLLGGTELYLGTEDIGARFERLMAAYPQVESIGIPTRIDLRYSNGFAVRWLPTADSGVGADRVAAINHRERS